MMLYIRKKSDILNETEIETIIQETQKLNPK